MAVDFESSHSVIIDELTPDYVLGASGLWVCVDPRTLSESCEHTQPDDAYNQIAGGMAGLAIDTALMMEVEKPESFTNEGLPVTTLGGVIAKVADEKLGAKFMNHLDCKAILFANKIGRAIIEDPTSILKSAQLMKPDISTNDIEKTQAGYTRILDAGLVPDPDVTLRTYESNDSEACRPVPAATLRNSANPTGYILDFRTHKRFDVVGANERALAAYYSSLGNLELLCRKLTPTIEMPYDKLLTQYIIRMASIHNQLKSAQGDLLPILTIDRAA